MKKMKKWICLIAVLCLLPLLSQVSFAETPEAEGDERFAGKTWEQVTESFIEERHADLGTVTIGYCNTVTGEEQYYNGDEYLVSGSLYKVPLNMVYIDRINDGEMDWDSQVCGYRYERALIESIVYSNNDISQAMAYALGDGNWHAFRETLVPYMCEDQENVEEIFFKNNYSTARQMTFCLKLLYDNQDRYPRIIDLMKEAEPNNYFLKHPQKVEVAHKYGYLVDGGILYLNDCGFCYTEDPFCLVVFTAGIMNPYEFLTDYCALMIDYTEYHTALRHEEELRLSREEAAQTLARATETKPGNSEGNSGEPSASAEPETEQSANLSSSLMAILVFGLTAAALATFLKLQRKKQLKLAWAIPALLFAAFALLLCVYAPGMRTAVTAGENKADPQESVNRFFDSLIAKDYPSAYDCLYDYASLGLEVKPEGEAARRMAEALQDSYSYTLYGDCSVDGLHAQQQVIFETLDLDAMQDELKTETENAVRRLSDELPRSEVLDENGDYLPELTARAYLEALDKLLEHADRYLTSVGLNLKLYYTTEGWRILTDSRLTQALCGRPAAAKGGIDA